MTGAARYDAKAPGYEFEPDSGKQQAATPTARAAADRWLGDLYRRLEALGANATDGATTCVSRHWACTFVGISRAGC